MLSPENHLFYIRDPGAPDTEPCKMVLYSSPTRKEDAFLQLPRQEWQVPDVSSADRPLPHFPPRTEVKRDTLRSGDAPRGSFKVSQAKKKNPFVGGSLLLVGPRPVRWIDQMSEATRSLVTQQPKGHVTRLSALLAVPQHHEPQRKAQKTPEDICLLSSEPSSSKYNSPMPGTPPTPPADPVLPSSTPSCSAAGPSTCPGLWLQDSQPSSS